jgi:tryptophanyl-tRNA synthetase
MMRAVTDSGKEIIFSDDPEKAGVNNLLTIYQAISNRPSADIVAEFEGKGYGDLKKAVAEQVVEVLRPLQDRYNELAGESGYLDDVLKEGAERAASVAEKTLKQVQECVGFLPRHW